ncbi:MAG TPA: IS982 family transposase [Chloroflexota bacterium]|nr:IS982 family transposase [Chloroflexota bacterium]
MSIADQMLVVFCFTDDFLQAHPNLAAWRTSNNARPKFSDAEVLTIALMQTIFQVATLKQAYLLVRSLFPDAFPHLPQYAPFLARLHRLTPLVGILLMKAGLRAVGAGNVFVLDSKPIPVCKPIRHGRVRLLREEGAYFGKNKAGWYFGYKLHVLAHTDGTIVGAFLTPANWDDRDVVAALAEGLEGNSIVLADLGYRDARELEPLLMSEYGVVLVTPAHAPKTQRALISRVRERIETVFSCLWQRFVDRVFSRSFEGLWSAIKIKMLHYNLCQAGTLQPLNS